MCRRARVQFSPDRLELNGKSNQLVDHQSEVTTFIPSVAVVVVFQCWVRMSWERLMLR